MKTLNIAGRTVSIDTEKLSRGLCELHEQDEEKKAVLAFGMLDANLCKMFDKHLAEAVKKQFSQEANELFESRITEFIKDCQSEVQRGVYKYALMIV